MPGLPGNQGKVDCWCLGWCSFCIITGTVLFNSTTPSDADEGWLRAKQHSSRDTLPDLWEQVAPHEAAGPANQFVSSLLSLNPSSRPSVLELCNDKFYQAEFRNISLASDSAERVAHNRYLTSSQRLMWVNDAYGSSYNSDVSAESGDLVKVFLYKDTGGWSWIEFSDDPLRRGWLP